MAMVTEVARFIGGDAQEEDFDIFVLDDSDMVDRPYYIEADREDHMGLSIGHFETIEEAEQRIREKFDNVREV